jgi:hypothetical protein
MARSITIKLTGLAEKFLTEMEKEGLNEADVISQGLGILAEVWRTNRVALVSQEFRNEQRQNLYDDSKFIEYYFHIQTPKSMAPQKPDNPNSEIDINYNP